MLSDEQIEILGDKIAGLYQALESDIIADIARRIKKTGRYTETAELMVKAMRDKGESPAKIRAEVMKLLRADEKYQKAVADNTLQYKKDQMREIRQVVIEAQKMGDDIIANAGNMSFNTDLSMWNAAGIQLKKDSAFTKLVEEMAATTNGTLKNLTQTCGFKGAHDFTSVKNAYTNSLDKALMKMTSGAFSYDQAVNDCIRELAHSGLRSVSYQSGKTYQLDTAARMCIRTSAHQLSAKITMHNCLNSDVDLVEVSAHWGARPSHQTWQGKVYSVSGDNKEYPDFAECEYGTAGGLCGVNCRHTFYPFFDGISVPTEWEPEPDPKEYNGKTYTYTEATQKQRQMERQVRATKREIEAQKAIGGDTKALESRKRQQINEYHQFSKAMDIRPKDNRLRVISGSSDLNRTNAMKSTLEKTKSAGILEIKKNDNKISDKDKRAIYDYISAKSYVLNEKLRKGLEMSSDELKLVEDINNALEKFPSYKGNLQRSLYFKYEEDKQEFLKDYVIRKDIEYKEFLSTTKGETYNPEGQVQIFIQNASNGKDISIINGGEQEVMYKTNSVFTVENIAEHNGVYYILLGEKNE